MTVNVQMNIVGRDGSVGLPLFISPQTTQEETGFLRPIQVPTGNHMHRTNVHHEVRTSYLFHILSRLYARGTTLILNHIKCCQDSRIRNLNFY